MVKINLRLNIIGDSISKESHKVMAEYWTLSLTETIMRDILKTESPTGKENATAEVILIRTVTIRDRWSNASLQVMGSALIVMVQSILAIGKNSKDKVSELMLNSKKKWLPRTKKNRS